MENIQTTQRTGREETVLPGRSSRWIARKDRRDLFPEARKQTCNAVCEARLVFEISGIVKQSLDLEKVLTPLLERMALTLGLCRAEVFVEHNEGMMEASFDGTDEETPASSAEAMADLREWVGRTEKPAAMLCEMDAPPGVALLCVPILVEGHNTGALCAERTIRAGSPPDDGLKTMEAVASILARAIAFRRSTLRQAEALKRENQLLRERIAHRFRPARMAGDSDSMQAVYAAIANAAPLNPPVLIHGEEGTGKKEAARALHEASTRRGRALITMDCACLPETVVENDRGSVPASVLVLAGCLKMAHGGTLLLTHIDKLPADVQPKLLRAVQKGEFERTGAMEPFPCDVRLIGSTSASFEHLADPGVLRSDLFQALCACSIRMPALRERRGDILPLAEHFLEKAAQRHGKKIERVSPAAVDLLLAYDWPGNVAELFACMDKAVALCGDGILRSNHFPPRLYASIDPQGAEAGLLDCALAALEHDMVVDALKFHRGNIAAAARQLGTTERIMGCRVKKFGLDLSRFAALPARPSCA